MHCMKNDTISYPENISKLRTQIRNYTNDDAFNNCKNMGEILDTILSFVKRNYLDISNKELF